MASIPRNHMPLIAIYRLAILLCLVHHLQASLQGTPLPAEMKDALSRFRTEGPFGWSFTQSSCDAEGKSLVETYDPVQSPPFRWELITKNGAPPNEEDKNQYRQNKVLRSSTLDAPRLESRLDQDSCELIEETPLQMKCRLGLKPGDPSDESSQFMSVLLVLDRPAKTITRVEISNTRPFSPTFGVSIQHSNTSLDYSVPIGDRPSLLLGAEIRIQGRLFWLKTLDQRMTITWTGHHHSGKQSSVLSRPGPASAP